MPYPCYQLVFVLHVYFRVNNVSETIEQQQLLHLPVDAVNNGMSFLAVTSSFVKLLILTRKWSDCDTPEYLPVCCHTTNS
jgi:hypothetical protein